MVNGEECVIFLMLIMTLAGEMGRARLREKNKRLTAERDSAVSQFNELVREVDNIDYHAQFSKDELKALRVLAHPDKHGSSKVASEITKKINVMISHL